MFKIESGLGVFSGVFSNENTPPFDFQSCSDSEIKRYEVIIITVNLSIYISNVKQLLLKDETFITLCALAGQQK